MEATELFTALADPTRLRIAHLVANRGPELCVCDIVSVLALPQSTVSRQLSMLKRMRLLHGRRDGTWMYYSLAQAPGRLQATLVSCLRECFDQDGPLTADLRRFDAMHTAAELACCATVAAPACSAGSPAVAHSEGNG